MTNHDLYMHRCLELAILAAGYTAPNPMVGAVLVHEGRVIGEGYHRLYGHAHAEVNCINSVAEEDKKWIPASVMYVSLEPCAHHGKTPPCADLIIDYKIPKVVVGCRDPFKEVDGKGIEKLINAGVEVITGVLEKECRKLNKRFFTFHTKKRPFIILKWAQSADHKIASAIADRLFITNGYSNRLVHKWRSEEAGILVGTNTALLDDPSLTNRLWHGKNPVRLVVDLNLRLPASLKLFDGQQATIVFNNVKHTDNLISIQSLKNQINFYNLSENENIVRKLLDACYGLNIQSILVEGGAQLLQSFIDEDVWDEARILTNEKLLVPEGLSSPGLTNAVLQNSEHILQDRIDYYAHISSESSTDNL